MHPYTAADIKLRVFTAAWHLPLIGAVGDRSMTRLNMGERCLRVWRHRGEFTPDEWAVYVGAIRRPASVRATVKFDRSVYANEIVRTIRDYRKWRLRVPTLHVAGACDPLIPHVPETYGPYADDMRIVRVPDCGHFVPEEATQEFLDLLDDFL